MIRKVVTQLGRLSDEQYASYLMAQDPLAGKISKEQQIEMITNAIACGMTLAKELISEHGQLSCDEYLNLYDVKVQHKEENSGLEYIYFGMFQKPDKMTIYDGNIAKGEQLLQKKDIQLFGQNSVTDVVKAHEFFHFFQEKRKDLYVNTHKIPLWNLGKLVYQSKYIAVAEVASMAFAKALLGLEVNPNILDVILLLPHNEKLAMELLETIKETKIGVEQNEVTNSN